jgi:hypothetical protein
LVRFNEQTCQVGIRTFSRDSNSRIDGLRREASVDFFHLRKKSPLSARCANSELLEQAGLSALSACGAHKQAGAHFQGSHNNGGNGWPGRMRETAGVKRIALAPSTNYERQLLEDAFDR